MGTKRLSRRQDKRTPGLGDRAQTGWNWSVAGLRAGSYVLDWPHQDDLHLS